MTPAIRKEIVLQKKPIDFFHVIFSRLGVLQSHDDGDRGCDGRGRHGVHVVGRHRGAYEGRECGEGGRRRRDREGGRRGEEEEQDR